MGLDSNYWEKRYQENSTGWDLGAASGPIIEYLESIIDKNIDILIPGCGNGYEAEWAHKQGFKSVHILDFAETAISNFRNRYKDFPEVQIHKQDFFLHQGCYDLIVEQTFFCAIDRNLREKYVQKVHQLLKPNGILAGVLFGVEFPSGPPFGGNKEEYFEYFSPLFDILHMEECYNSIKPRKGNELFIELKKKSI